MKIRHFSQCIEDKNGSIQSFIRTDKERMKNGEKCMNIKSFCQGECRYGNIT